MAYLRCKMCGGDLDIQPGSSVATCEFCGTQQTIPTVNDDLLQGLFNRANVLRMKSEFDKAADIYEKILQSDPDQAEAYWGLILCKYGVEYVEDPKTLRRIPTCHRTSYDAITADEDYKNALRCADAVQRRIYEAEAAAIDAIQKGILAISQKEEPYDVFLCYKETDASGKRTVDSTIANDIYYQLTQEGFKVFFAAITLEDKLGTEYEPYIFSALNTAKVMLVLGTKPEHFNAVWVKNEWSRFLKLMKQDRSRRLIPCYRDMDAYELPEEFAHLQAQDMSKIGFINDVVRGIKKLIVKEAPAPAPAPQPAAPAAAPQAAPTANVTALLDRGNMALEDGQWDKANDYFDQVLNLDARCGEAYQGMFLAEKKVRDLDEFVEKIMDKSRASNGSVGRYYEACPEDTQTIEDAVKKYAQPEIMQEDAIREQFRYDREVRAFTEWIQQSQEDVNDELEDNKHLYRSLQFLTGKKKAELEAALAKIGEKQRREINRARQFEDQRVEKVRTEYAQFVREKLAEVEAQFQKEAERVEKIYQAAKAGEASAETIADYVRAEKLYGSIKGYKDAADGIGRCRSEADQLRREEARQQEVRMKEAEAAQAAAKKAAARKKMKQLALIAAATAAVPIMILFITQVIIPAQTYKNAIALRDAGDYMGAVRTFRKIPYYKDVQEQLEDFKIVHTKETYVSEDRKYRDDTTYEYDAQGNLISKVEIDDDGDVDRYTYEYDEKGNLLSEAYVSRYSNNTTTYRYDGNGNVLLKKTEYKDGDKSQCTYQYDEKGNLIFEQNVYADGKKDQHTYRYDENNNQIFRQSIYSDGRKHEFTWTYDESGNKLTERYLYGGGSTGYYEYTYDKDGNLLVTKEENYDGEMEVVVQYTYDEHGNLVKEKRGASEKADEIQYTYDGYGRVTQRCFMEYSWGDYIDKTYTYYTYDEDGNLTKISGGSGYTYSDYLAFYCPQENR